MSSPFSHARGRGSIQTDIRVIGTAGHVDHGKSTLIAALTGIHPDRLKEEQEREMTIDLGFGWMTLPGGREVGFVDVPGHRDFVENMLAGVGGIDAVWLVIAADEGVMPQTREHLAIIDLIGIRGGVLVLTKTDLIVDPAWLEVVEADVRASVRGTTLEAAPIVRVSARTGSGLPDLLASTAALLDQLPPRADRSRPRLAIDRVFSMEGFGTVVTGTLTDGALTTGDGVEFLPSGMNGRVRGIQTHHRKVERAVPGSRTAVNVSGISAEALQRGEVLVHPGQYEATRRLDARIRLLPSAASNLTHNRDAKLFVATSQTMCRVRLLGLDQVRPGEEGWIQLELQDPVVCARGDAFVLRLPSPPETIGGGTIVEPHPASRHRRHDESVLLTLQTLAAGNPVDVLYEAASSLGPAPAAEIVGRSGLAADEAATALSGLLATSRLVSLVANRSKGETEALVLTDRNLELITRRTKEALSTFHAKFPLRAGMPREELRSQLGLETGPFQAVMDRLENVGHVSGGGGYASLTGHVVRLTPAQEAAVDLLMSTFASSPYAPPSVKECIKIVGMELWTSLREQGTLVLVSADVVFSGTIYERMVSRIKLELEGRGQITLADVRDLFGTSRRYAQSLLEHLDQMGVTRRIGDSRVLASTATDRAR